MKQTLLLVAAMLYCTVRSVREPFWAVLMYYGLAVLRPNAIWRWALPEGVRWSLYAAGIAIVATVAHAALLGRPVVQKWFLWLVAFFSLCVAGSSVVAIDPAQADVSGWELAKVLIMLFVGSVVIRQRWHFRYLAWMIFASLSYVVYELNLMYLIDGRMDIVTVGYGGLDNNGAALMLAMGIPFGYYFFWAERRWWRWGFLFCAVSAVNMIMLSASRGAMLSALVAGAGMVLTTGRQRLRVLAVAGALAVVVLALAGPSVRDRFFTINQMETDASAQSRFGSWAAAWKIIEDYPLFGTGPGGVRAISKAYGADIEGRAIHNSYLEVGAEHGAPAMLAYTAILGCAMWWLFRGWRSVRDPVGDSDGRWHHYMCKACFWSLATFMIGTVFLSMQTVELPYLLALMGAVAPALARPANQGDARDAGRPALRVRGPRRGKQFRTGKMTSNAPGGEQTHR